MTSGDHANTVRHALADLQVRSKPYTAWQRDEALAALDALQAQAEAVEKRRIVTTTVQGDTHMNRLRERAEAAEAERDRLAKELEWVGALNKANIENGHRLRDERDRLRDALREIVGDAYNLITQGESPTQRRQPSARRIYDRSRAALAGDDT